MEMYKHVNVTFTVFNKIERPDYEGNGQHPLLKARVLVIALTNSIISSN